MSVKPPRPLRKTAVFSPSAQRICSAIPQNDLNNIRFFTKTAAIGHKKGCCHRGNTVIL